MKTNQRIKLGKTGLFVNPVAYGGIISMNETQKDSDEYVAYAVENGINYFDVAPGYGNAREIMGKSLKPYRKGIYLACKTNNMMLDEGKKDLEESLELLHTDYFDVFQLHGLTKREELEQAFSDKGIMNYLVKAKQEGIVRNIGFSAHDEDVALEAVSTYDFDTVLFPFNWALYPGKGFGKRILEKANEKNMGKLALKALAHRQLKDGEAEKYPKSWYKPFDLNDEMAVAALKYTISLGVDVIVPPGYFEYLKFTLEKFEECRRNPLDKKEARMMEKALRDAEEDMIF